MKAAWETCRLAVLATIAVMAMGGVAGASAVTSPAGTAYTGEVMAIPTKAQFVIDTAGTFVTECSATTFQFTPEYHGPTVTAKGNAKYLFFEGCSPAEDITTLSWGYFEFHPLGNGNGTVTSSEFVLTTTEAAPFGTHCKYKTSSTHFGTLTGSKNTGGAAILHIAGTSIPKDPTSSVICGSLEFTSGSYEIETPSYLDIS
ncbi:MAG TPA: hypothetical protein VFT79_09065 [Solirubrobacterales bacterium]|nr:hypothetical protein [Solirubrobacterales bacterium]